MKPNKINTIFCFFNFKRLIMRKNVLNWMVGAVSLVSLQAQAMDVRFKDGNGDLVADAPVDPKQWIDPATLVFAYTPVEDPAVYAPVWAPFLDHLSKVTGKKVQFFPVQSNAAQNSPRLRRESFQGCGSSEPPPTIGRLA